MGWWVGMVSDHVMSWTPFYTHTHTHKHTHIYIYIIHSCLDAGPVDRGLAPRRAVPLVELVPVQERAEEDAQLRWLECKVGRLSVWETRRRLVWLVGGQCAFLGVGLSVWKNGHGRLRVVVD